MVADTKSWGMNRFWVVTVLIVFVAVVPYSRCCHVEALRGTSTIDRAGVSWTSNASSSIPGRIFLRHQQHLQLLYPHRGGAREPSNSMVSPIAASAEVDPITKRELFDKHWQSNTQQWMNKNFFVLGMMFTVMFAYSFPSLGMTNGILHPELLLNQYGVSYVFLLSGLSIQLSQIKEATYNMKLNTLVQFILFIIWPFCIGVPMQYVGNQFASVSKPLIDGLLVLSCLPTTVNMCVILTSTAGGNVATALCNAVLSNLLGIVATPLLLFRFFGSDISLPFYEMVVKLVNKVLLPVTLGQLLRAQVPSIRQWYYRNEKLLKRSQEVVLLGILWNAFCTAISSQLGVSFKDGITLLTILPVVHLVALAGTFVFFSLPALKFSRSEAVAAMFCASQKTLAFGLPIIQTIFEGNANLAMYSAPLMIVHPMQLMIGSILVPRLERYIKSSKLATGPRSSEA